MTKKKDNMMLISTAKRFAVGDVVENLDIVVTTAGKVNPVPGDDYGEQKLGITDGSGHIWAIIILPKNKPIHRGLQMIVKEATVDEFTNKGNEQEKRLVITKWEIPTMTVDEMDEKENQARKAGGVLDPLVERILEKYDISATDALWPCTHKGKTNWVIYHRYCEQIAAKAGIVFGEPELVVNETDDKGKRTVVLLLTGQLGHVKEWTYGEASPATTFLAYTFAIAEKRAKDRLILKLAGFHGMVYSDVEEDWSKNGV